MDYYLNTNNTLNRLLTEYKKYGSLVIAYDFDDTVYDFHRKGHDFSDIITLLCELKSINCCLICWTGQQDLDFVKSYLNELQIPVDLINENPPFYQSSSRKIYANAYLDDRAGLHQVFLELKKVVELVKNNKI